MRQARARYFADNNFGEDGGYDATWVKLKAGPIPFAIPNTPGRVRAVQYHDLHHILTGYQTDWAGEFEISAWEVAGGCRSMVAAWVINLSGLACGAILWPRRIFAAFVRGRHTRNLYDQEIEAMLELPVEEARRLTGMDQPPPVTSAADRLAFVAWTGMAMVLTLAPLVLLLWLLWWGAGLLLA
jgi:hypothetical protein